MTYFKTSDGKAVEAAQEFSTNNSFEAIPDKTEAQAYTVAIGWKQPDSEFSNENKYIEVEWSILAPESLKNRKIFQKIRLHDEKESKRDNAIRMMAAIYTIGGKVDISKVESEPTDADLAKAALNIKAVITIGLFTSKKDGEEKKINYISGISAKNKKTKENAALDDDDDLPM